MLAMSFASNCGHLHTYRTDYCGPNGVLNREVLLYRTDYCGPNGVLKREVLLYTYSEAKCCVNKTLGPANLLS